MARPKKATTPEERNRAKDQRIQHKFGITLADKNRRAEEQHHKCAVCGGPLEAYGPPNIDHYHFYVKATRHFDTFLMALSGWEAQGFNERDQEICVRRADTKKQAVADVKKVMMPWSIRGLCCFKCNRGMGVVEKFFNAARHPENLLPLIEYYRARLNLPLTSI